MLLPVSDGVSHLLASSSDSNLNHRAKMQLRLTVGGAWRVMMDMPCAHYLLDMQNAKDRVIACKVLPGIFLHSKRSCSHICTRLCWHPAQGGHFIPVRYLSRDMTLNRCKNRRLGTRDQIWLLGYYVSRSRLIPYFMPFVSPLLSTDYCLSKPGTPKEQARNAREYLTARELAELQKRRVSEKGGGAQYLLRHDGG